MTLSLSDPTWYPIASSEDLPFRHVYQGQLLGRELAVWRADDGNVNVWENRCLHRGVRLSIGINEGGELKCQYHGWRYANRSAGCTYIPAHPADAPARRIQNRTYPVREAYGLVWSAANDELPFAPFPGAETGDWFALRPMPVNAAPEDVLDALATPDAERLPGLSVRSGDTIWFVQPVEANRSVIRGLVAGQPDLAILRQHNEVLTRLRDRLERAAARKPAPEPLQPVFEKVSADLATMPEIAIPRGNTMPVVVKRKWQSADGVTGFELAARDGHLPTFQPGAHIDLHLPNGLIRQYSITNGPGELMSYIIGVKAESASKGGSQVLIDSVREGDVLAISEPRNNFPLRRDATRTVLIAGGIGITPLLSMARFLDKSSLPYELHYFVRTGEQAAFRDQLEALSGKVIIHQGLPRAEIATTIAITLGPWSRAQHVYVCGPSAMLESVRATAAEQGWPDEAIHFEYFKNDKIIDDSSSFEIELARSAVTLHVPSGRTILETMREAGLTVPSSCEQGACGTCLTAVMEGEVDHQDVYLNDSEKASNTCMMTCVSRAKSARLVLDI
ncbi:Rieske 2Fe-2S domain-containing protein [Devosia neptuniae]|uniref:Rieske 2Fe-2S domain-containing protein n=1 Tax=Devosia neptuniae TaxID=191302 RepID=A0ABY6C852_9HYPH|nr:Rieske 2Fe-2S domain-containing protein [Devosia neptuniae]UXN68312.1 Rieske 2Fe-2S domain-containing protein [Devosia neptuniae]